MADANYEIQSLISDLYPQEFFPKQILRVEANAGFSGSTVWRCETNAGTFALKQWPATASPEYVRFTHCILLALREQEIDYVPCPIAGKEKTTVASRDNVCWELATWQHGKPHQGGQISDIRLKAAIKKLAEVHQRANVLRQDDKIVFPFDQRLLAAFHRAEPLPCWSMASRVRGWQRVRDTYQNLITSQDAEWDELSFRTRQAVQKHHSFMEKLLTLPMPHFVPQICLVDIHADHILFTEDQVTGLIDFASAGLDTPARDFGRLVGSFVGNDAERWRQALSWYREIEPLWDQEAKLASIFDRTGAVLAALGWQERLFGSPPEQENTNAAFSRWRALVERLENFEFDCLPF